MVGNTFMPIRSVFAWSFDRLLPEKFAEVNERTHSPVPAILLVMAIVTVMLAWSIVSTDFGTWLALGVLAGVVCVVIVAVAAFVFSSRRPDLYQASPANVKSPGSRSSRSSPRCRSWSCCSWSTPCWRTRRSPCGDSKNAWWVPAFMIGDRRHRPGDLLRREVHPPEPGDRHRPRLSRAAARVTRAVSRASALARFRRRLRPSSTSSAGAYGPGIRKHGRPPSATPSS